MSNIVDEITEHIFTCAFDDQAFANLPDKLTAMVGGRSCTLQFLNKEWQHFDFVWNHFSYEMFQDYVREFMPDDLWMTVGKRLTLNRVQNLDRFVPFEEHTKSRIYNEFYRAHGDDTAHCLGTVGANPAGYFSLGVHRAHNQGTFTDVETERLQAVLPYLARLHQTRARLRTTEIRADLSSKILDRLSFGAVIVTGQRKILTSNLEAENILRGSDAIIAAFGFLKAHNGAQDKRLGELIHDGTARRPRQGGAMLVWGDERASPVRIMTTPIPNSDLVLLIFDTGRGSTALPDIVSSMYGLSPAEAMLAAAVAKGERLEDFAVSRSVRLSTVRTQISSVLSKTGTDKQSQLAALLASLPAIKNADE